MSFVIIRLKSSQDILQGINKLDCLLKVSVFQVYKDSRLEQRKFSIVTSTDNGSEYLDTDAIVKANRQSTKV